MKRVAARRHHHELHRSGRTGWLRAAVLGSNDAIVSTSSLMMGVAGSEASPRAIMIAGVAGLAAGAMSMAVGEFVSVSSQRDAEIADIAIEKRELAEAPEGELKELAGIYRDRGLESHLAMEVAKQLTKHDGLATHLRDELGIEDNHGRARPLQAAWVSAASFASFALIPIAALVLVPSHALYAIPAASLVGLAGLGAFGAYLGGAPMLAASVRVTIGGAIAMALTALIGRLLGVAAG
ncbi:MAG TPA: VIT family protein [Kofleriaceae bacterium]|jgi:VIT1/CCC1 family predicted Fe2+/Mn2+ transporter